MKKDEIAGLIDLLSSPDDINRELAIELAISQGISIKELSEICVDNFYNDGVKTWYDYDFLLGIYSLYRTNNAVIGRIYEWYIYNYDNDHQIADEDDWRDTYIIPEYFEKLIEAYLNDK